MKRISSFILFLAALSSQGLFLATGLPQTPNPSLKQRYRSAVQDAAIVDSSKVVNNLIQVTPENTWLVWNETKTKVLVVTWKRQNSYDRFIKPFNNTSKDEDKVIWVTVAPQVQEFCRHYLQTHANVTEEALKLRLKQYLGLDPDWEYDLFIELWVSPQDLFRPCVDPEVTDQQCNLEFGELLPKVAGITKDSGIDNYRRFYQDLYFKSIRQALQPWTGLGYTYDWSNPVYPIGASEFILIPGATYTIKQATPTLHYCQSPVPQTNLNARKHYFPTQELAPRLNKPAIAEKQDNLE
jgi:hypothetical protein